VTAPVPVRSGDATARSALSTHGLCFAVGGARIVEDVSLDVRRGELLGVIGPNGAGKTTLFNLLSGLLRPTAGRIRLAGVDVTPAGPARRARAGLGRSFQTSSVFAGLPVAENVRLAAEARIGGSMRLWRRPDGFRPAVERAAEALDTVGLAARSAVPAGRLSHGDKRKLELAILLATDPDVILLDEPMAGVSMEDVPDLVAVIERIAREQHRTVLMVEHHMDVVLRLADRVAVMHHGALLACAGPDAVMGDPVVQSAYLGEPM
jgi:branched-chain amino acid transport system ATP-binding protein